MLVTLGQSEKLAPVGTMSLAKMRRGETNRLMRVHLAGSKATIIEISEDEYQRMKAQAKEVGDKRFQK